MSPEMLAIGRVLTEIGPYGVPALMAFLWWLSIRSLKEAYATQAAAQEKANGKILEEYKNVLGFYKTDLAAMAEQHRQILEKMSEKYDNNAVLCRDFGTLSQRYAEQNEYLKKLIEVNIQTMQQCTDVVERCRKKAEKP